MAIDITNAAKTLVNLYQYKDASERKELFIKTVSRYNLLDETEDFLKNNIISELERDPNKWSKKEKNLFVHFIKDNPYKDLIVEEYNRGVANHDSMENKEKVFKQLKSITEFLKSPAYKDDESFKKNVILRCMEWGFDEDYENISILKKSLSLYADKETINDFVSPDSEKKKNAFAILKGMDWANETKEMNSSTLLSIAAITSLGGPVMLGVVQEGAVKMIDGVTKFVSETGQLGMKLAEVINNHPSITTVAGVGAGLYLGYKAFQEFHKIAKQFRTKVTEEQVAGINIDKINEEKSTDFIANKLLGTLIRKKPFDMQDIQNQKYVQLCTFLVEKLKNPKLEVPPQMQKELRLTNVQVFNLNLLDKEKIHELALVQNPISRTALMMEMPFKIEKDVLKTISIMEEIGNIKTHQKHDGKIFPKLSSVKNLSATLREEIESSSAVDKAIATAYIGMYTESNGTCPTSVLRTLHNCFESKKSLSSLLHAELDTEYFNMKPTLPKNEELAYFKRIWNWCASKDARVADTVNEDVKKVIFETTTKYGFDYADEINEKNLSLFNAVGRGVHKIKEDVIGNIGKIRDKVAEASVNTLRALIP